MSVSAQRLPLLHGSCDVDDSQLQAAFGTQAPEDNVHHYRQWSATYDQDVADYGYLSPLHSVEALRMHFCNLNGRVLDVGCGTGLVGELLKHYPAFTHVEGADICKEMLAKAASKKLYSDLFRADLTKRIGVEDGAYNAIICVGTFTLGHVGRDALCELLRCTAVGGIVVVSVNAGVWFDEEYEGYLKTLQDADVCTILEMKKVTLIRQPYNEGFIVTLRRA